MHDLGLEAQLENWLANRIDVLADHGWDLEMLNTQVFCGRDHGGTIDMLCRLQNDPSAYVIIELKAGEARRDAVAQVLGYMAWLLEQKGVDNVSSIVIGKRQHSQLRYALRQLDDHVVWISWMSCRSPLHSASS